jgi:hypothetical protein
MGKNADSVMMKMAGALPTPNQRTASGNQAMGEMGERTVCEDFPPSNHDLGWSRKLVGGVQTRDAPPQEHDKGRPHNAKPDPPGDGSIHRDFSEVAFLAK